MHPLLSDSYIDSIPSLMPRQLVGTLWALGTAATPLLREPAADAEGTGGKAAAATLQAQSLCKPEGPATHGQGPPASHPPPPSPRCTPR